MGKNTLNLRLRGDLVRSKSEWIIADKLHWAGIDYQYEQLIILDSVERYPNFTIVDDDSGTTWYWEHNGMLSNEEYRQRWERKLAAYRRQDIRPLAEGGGKNGTLNSGWQTRVSAGLLARDRAVVEGEKEAWQFFQNPLQK